MEVNLDPTSRLFSTRFVCLRFVILQFLLFYTRIFIFIVAFIFKNAHWVAFLNRSTELLKAMNRDQHRRLVELKAIYNTCGMYSNQGWEFD